MNTEIPGWLGAILIIVLYVIAASWIELLGCRLMYGFWPKSSWLRKRKRAT